ncbi:DUF2179 domain-containing protein [Metamycoplasma auris]|uniref:Uncharacterized protein DUF2179 n=1 Tax=Metamycoplasma auris TaxID=51363 RepID=A0A2W7G8W1_9BACT|nr:DUF2179 domain-containing protein [Metamycoplasma auris]PZW01491.1 uncharacterized protein DUF2179 [Metamycoplasma auris]
MLKKKKNKMKLDSLSNNVASEEFNALSSQIKKKKKGSNSLGYNINPYGVNFFNIWKKFPKKMLMVFISAILYNLAVAIFLGKAAAVATGLSAIVQAVTLTVSKAAPYFAYIYLGLNLPFIFIFWKKNSRLFMILTTYWLLWQVAFQTLLLVPQVSDIFKRISIYYVNWYAPDSIEAPRFKNEFRGLIPWETYGAYSHSYKNLFAWMNNNIDNNINIFANANTYTFNLSKPLEAGVSLELGKIKYITQNQFYQLSHFKTLIDNGYNNPTWPIIVYVAIGAIMAGIAGGMAWKNSASTSGADFVVYYLSRVKQKSIGHISLILAIIFGSFAFILITIIEALGVTVDKPFNFGGLLLRFLGSALYVVIYIFMLEFIYPKYRKIRIEIYTKNPDKIISRFKEINYWHAYNIEKLVGGYTNTETIKIETYALYLEQSLIKNEVLIADPKAWVTITRVHKIYGGLDTSKVES